MVKFCAESAGVFPSHVQLYFPEAPLVILLLPPSGKKRDSSQKNAKYWKSGGKFPTKVVNSEKFSEKPETITQRFFPEKNREKMVIPLPRFCQ